jgi:hypothetical protein
MHPTDENIRKINKFPKPKTHKQIKQFLGICNYYRTFIPKCAEVVRPLEKLISKKKN